MKKFLAECPGLVGDIARYINGHFETEQPAIALSAAFGFMSALLSKRVCCIQSGKTTEPCLFTVAVADSGSGKTQAQIILSDIIKTAGLSTSNTGFLLGIPASDSGLLKALANNPRRFFIWDEMGLSLSAYAKSKNSCEANILSTAMKLFTMAGKMCVGKEYSTQDRVDVKEPYLSIFGGSTHNRFFGALNQDFVEDGFLPRWLIFFESEKREEKEVVVDTVAFESIVNRVRTIESWSTAQTSGNLGKAIPEEMERDKLTALLLPETLPGDVFDRLEYWKDEISSVQASTTRGSIKKILYTRAYEQTLKICLCLSERQVTRVVCSPESIDFAVRFTSELIKTSCCNCEEHIYRNERAREYGKLRQKILELLKRYKQLSKTELHKRSRNFGDARERGAAIEDLVESGMVRTDFISGRTKKTIFYTYAEGKNDKWIDNDPLSDHFDPL